MMETGSWNLKLEDGSLKPEALWFKVLSSNIYLQDQASSFYYRTSIMIIILSILLGLAIGSFINAYVWRMEKGKSVWRGKSQCPKCSHQLAWRDLIPVISYILLEGRCRYCQKKISIQYPIVEILTAVLFAIIYWQQKDDFSLVSLVFWWFIVSALIIIAVYDLKTQLVPSNLIYLTAVIIAAAWIAQTYTNLKIHNSLFIIPDSTVGLIIGAGVMGFIVWLTRGKGMGAGDIELGGLLGLLLGYPLIVINLALAFIVGAVFSIGLLGLKLKKLKDPIPLGPFLIGSAFIALFWGKKIGEWYMGLIT